METKEKLVNATDFFKDRKFGVSSALGAGQINHTATVLKSYDYLCLCKVQKAAMQGGFHELGIYRIIYDQDQEMQLSPIIIDYSTDDHPKYGAPDNVVEAKFNDIVSKLKVQFFEKGIVSDRQLRENKAKEAAKKTRLENISYTKDRQSAIHSQLLELCAGVSIQKLSSDRKILALLSEHTTLENLKKYTTR